ncbi:MAG: 3-deoxy-manno-octulosonate cytidylyltransferase [Bacteroidota bacterium]|jgi:3-deoxy-manno-octulosonate cytidylyltransferase (CMP-KDO synthetase)
MSVIGIIPARYASSRFPGKPLALIHGKSMLQRVYEQAMQANLISTLIIATDDERISKHAEDFGARAILTSAHHVSGTDRCYEAYQNYGQTFDYVLNIQGDEPLLNPAQINELCAVADGVTEIATQMIKCNSHDVLFDTNEVKIALNTNQEALLFSRNVIPFIKNKPEKEWHNSHDFYRHVGMYMYKTTVLKEITALSPGKLETAESLEQLRWLENGYKIKCIETKFDSHCVDTPEDLEKIKQLIPH